MNDVASSGAGIQTAMFDAVCDALTVACIVYDRNDQIIYASRQLLNHFPLSENSLLPGSRLKDLIGAIYDCRQIGMNCPTGSGSNLSGEEWIAERLASSWKERSERVERQSSGRWLRYTKRRLPSGIGISVITDISEQKKREDQWRADLERVQLTEEILDSLPFPIFVKDRRLSYVAVNKASCTLLESSPENILGRTVYDIHAHNLASRIDSVDRHVLETGLPVNIPERLTRLDGEEAVIITRKQRVGKPGRYFLVTTMEDITALTVADDNGQRIIPGIEHLSFVNSSYRGNIVGQKPQGVSAGLKGKSILLVTSNLALGESVGKRLLVAGVDFATVTSEQQEQAFLDMAVSAKVAIDLVVVDTQMSLNCLDLAKNYGLAFLTVDDFQMGGPLMDVISHHFAQREHFNLASGDDDWEISTQSGIVTKDENRGCDVLVVEDNNVNKIVFSQILEGLGFSYVIASSGEEALHLFMSHSPAIVLMDTTLPDFDGFEACRRIRAMESKTNMRTPVIGVVALAFEGDREACSAAGMDDMLLKPISPDIIEALFKRILPARRHQHIV